MAEAAGYFTKDASNHNTDIVSQNLLNEIRDSVMVKAVEDDNIMSM